MSLMDTPDGVGLYWMPIGEGLSFVKMGDNHYSIYTDSEISPVASRRTQEQHGIHIVAEEEDADKHTGNWLPSLLRPFLRLLRWPRLILAWSVVLSALYLFGWYLPAYVVVRGWRDPPSTILVALGVAVVVMVVPIVRWI